MNTKEEDGGINGVGAEVNETGLALQKGLLRGG